MATLVGTQKDFDDAIIALVELEYDAKGAYELAIEKLQNTSFKNTLTDFLEDHKHHISQLKEFYAFSGIKLPNSADLVKGTLAKLKVAIGGMVDSDTTILKAILDNEKDTNEAYERINNHAGKPQALSGVLVAAFADEKKHKTWLEKTLG